MRDQRRLGTVVVSTINNCEKRLVVIFKIVSNSNEKLKSMVSGGSMVARVKLKGIDGGAPPGVEPAT